MKIPIHVLCLWEKSSDILVAKGWKRRKQRDTLQFYLKHWTYIFVNFDISELTRHFFQLHQPFKIDMQ